MDAGAVFDALVDVGPGLHDLPAYLGPERREQVAALAAPSPATRPARPPGPRAEGEGGAALAWPGDGAYLTGFSDPYLAADVARAANDWTIARCEAAGGLPLRLDPRRHPATCRTTRHGRSSAVPTTA